MIKGLQVYLKRFKNTGTIVATASALLYFLTTIGVRVDIDWLMNAIQAACALGVILGILNDPKTPGLDVPKKTK
jgi:uncharacterized membrane protein